MVHSSNPQARNGTKVRIFDERFSYLERFKLHVRVTNKYKDTYMSCKQSQTFVLCHKLFNCGTSNGRAVKRRGSSGKFEYTPDMG